MSWKEFVSEVTEACRNKGIPHKDLKKWINSTIPNVEKEITASLVSVGPTRSHKDLLIDILILTDSILHGFTIFKKGKEHAIYRLKPITAILERESEGLVKVEFFAGSASVSSLSIEVDEEDYGRVRKFIDEILTKWG